MQVGAAPIRARPDGDARKPRLIPDVLWVSPT
jgi:hypothetical protein